MQGAAAIAAMKVLQETQEIRARVSLGTFSDDPSRSDFERRVEARKPIALIVVRLASRKIRAQRQQRLGSLERLDLRLLIDAEHDGMGRRMEIEADHVSDLLFRPADRG